MGINLVWLALLVGLGVLLHSQPLGGLMLLIGGVVQVLFGALLLANHRGLAEGVAEYFSHRPLGRLLLNRSVRMNRAQGGFMLVIGFVLAIAGAALLLSRLQMQIVACLLLILVGVSQIAVAIDPTIPVLRSAYWWRIPFKGRPTLLFERLPGALMGLVLIAAAGYLLVYVLR
jgi:hypothetical protein